MSNFPKLIPAFTALIVLDPVITIGTVSAGMPLLLAPFIPENGSLKSEPGYPINVNATFVHGSDYLRMDPSGKHFRLSVNSLLKDKTGAMIKFDYDGVVALTPQTAAVFSGKKDVKTTEFGDAVIRCKFETGSDELRALESQLYVASGRFILEPGKPVTVEYKISQVTA